MKENVFYSWNLYQSNPNAYVVVLQYDFSQVGYNYTHLYIILKSHLHLRANTMLKIKCQLFNPAIVQDI